MSTPAPASVLAPKPHYAALDGLRGVAAVMVVLFHMFEGSARDQKTIVFLFCVGFPRLA